MPNPDLLRDDHTAIDKILDRALTALEQGNGSQAFEYLDRFWARLAVHIRAEHLQLFPALLRTGPDVSVEALIDGLRADHNFFMAELGSLIKEWRRAGTSNRRSKHPSLASETRDRLDLLRQRLAVHNEIEESQVYRMIDVALSTADAKDLSLKIETELGRLPRRLTEQ